MFLGEDDDRSFSEVSKDAIEKIQEANIVQEYESSVELDADLDEKEAAYIRMELLHPNGAVLKEEVDVDAAAQLSLISLAERIDQKLADIDDEAREAISGKKEKIGFDELDPDEKKKFGQDLAAGERSIRRFLISAEVFQDVIVFYMVAGSLMEKYSSELLRERVVDEELRGTDDAETWTDEMNQGRRETILKMTGVLSEDFVNQMGEVRENRNKLAHEIQHQQQLQMLEDVGGDVDHALDVLGSLYRELYEEGFPKI